MSAERLARAVRELTERGDGWPPTQRELAVELNVKVSTVNAWARNAVKQGLCERGPQGQLRVSRRAVRQRLALIDAMTEAQEAQF